MNVGMIIVSGKSCKIVVTQLYWLYRLFLFHLEVSSWIKKVSNKGSMVLFPGAPLVDSPSLGIYIESDGKDRVKFHIQFWYIDRFV